MQKDDRLFLGHMLDAAREAVSLIQEKSKVEYDGDRTLRLALAHLIQIIGEAARRVSPECRETRPEIPWKAVVGMRHKVVHNYFEVDEELVWKTVVEDLPALISELERFFETALGLNSGEQPE